MNQTAVKPGIEQTHILCRVQHAVVFHGGDKDRCFPTVYQFLFQTFDYQVVSLAAAGGAEVSGAGNLPALDSSGVKVPATDTLSSPSAAANENKPVAIDQEAVARARERVAREQARREAQAAKEARKAEKDAAAAAKAAAREAEWARRDSIDAVKAALKAEKKARKENARRMKQLEAARKRAAKEQAIIEKYMAKY
jgi:flagellar biosynthesis GTPase FlhF